MTTLSRVVCVNCLQVAQGYGLTETCAVSFVSAVDCMDQSATVGPPTPLTELQLESVPELNYDATAAEEPKVCGPSFQVKWY